VSTSLRFLLNGASTIKNGEANDETENPTAKAPRLIDRCTYQRHSRKEIPRCTMRRALTQRAAQV
jgi:hypothetical protein